MSVQKMPILDLMGIDNNVYTCYNISIDTTKREKLKQ
jgi:hypothetical protein